eukprot:365455-Chlamydomonas_euryale.AAC.25
MQDGHEWQLHISYCSISRFPRPSLKCAACAHLTGDVARLQLPPRCHGVLDAVPLGALPRPAPGNARIGRVVPRTGGTIGVQGLGQQQQQTKTTTATTTAATADLTKMMVAVRGLRFAAPLAPHCIGAQPLTPRPLHA